MVVNKFQEVCNRDVPTITEIGFYRLEASEMKVLRKIVGKTKIARIRSQQIREFWGIQPINEWVERRREWDEHVTRMYTERLVKISRDNIPAGRRSPGCPKRRWSDFILHQNRRNRLKKEEEEEEEMRSTCNKNGF